MSKNIQKKKGLNGKILRRMRGVKHLVVGALLVVLALSAFVRAEACWVEEWKRDQPIIINSMLAAFSLFNVPEALQARYELFHTAYVDGRRITIVNQPLIPGQNLTSLLQIVKSIKEAYEKGLLAYTANETGFYAYYNDTLTLAVEKAEGDGWNVKFGEWTSRRLDANTWLNFTTLWINVNGTVLEYLVLVYVRHINESHKLYVITLAQVEGGRYGVAFTWANYWFKNKTVYFGDWVVVANTTLSSYYAAMSRAVDALAKKRQASDKQYKPQAYPQISQALREISRAVAGTDIDKPLGRGYALVTDIAPAVKAYIIAVAGGAVIGTITATFTYARTGDARRAALCATWITFQTGVLGGFGVFMSRVAGTAWGVYRGAVTAAGGGFLC
jgi:hypothetical protein